MTYVATKEQFVNLCMKLKPSGLSPGLLGFSTIQQFAGSAFESLARAYGGENRKYHTLEHVGWGLHRIDEMEEDDKTRGGAHSPLEWNLIRLAFWYHDSVLNGSSDDEEKSASKAYYMADLLGVEASVVGRLVMATSHERLPLRMDEAIICDADLSILGSNQEAFDRYESLVRQEWAHVPDNLFKPARFVILQRFAKRPWIYMTDYGRARWERRARANLTRSMEALSK